MNTKRELYVNVQSGLDDQLQVQVTLDGEEVHMSTEWFEEVLLLAAKRHLIDEVDVFDELDYNWLHERCQNGIPCPRRSRSSDNMCQHKE